MARKAIHHGLPVDWAVKVETTPTHKVFIGQHHEWWVRRNRPSITEGALVWVPTVGGCVASGTVKEVRGRNAWVLVNGTVWRYQLSSLRKA